MGRIIRSLKSYINGRLLTVACLVVSIVLVILEMLLLPWEEITKVVNDMLSSSMTLLSIICIVSSFVGIIVAIVTILRTDNKLKKEKEKMNATLTYIKLIGDFEKVNSHRKMIEELMHGEHITRQEYNTFQELYAATTNEANETTCETIVNTIATPE